MSWTTSGTKALIVRWVREDEGQDLIEYALLAVTVALGAVTALNFLLNAMGTSYNQSMTNVGGQWQTPDPSGK